MAKQEKLAPAGSFGRRVYDLRKTKGLNQTALAKQVGIRQSSLSDIETGTTTVEKVRAATVLGLAKALSTNPNFLRTGKESPVEPEQLTVEESEIIALYRELAEVNPAMCEQVVSHFRGVLHAQKIKPTKTAPFRRHKAIAKVE